jgi:hypothetical protein
MYAVDRKRHVNQGRGTSWTLAGRLAIMIYRRFKMS